MNPIPSFRGARGAGPESIFTAMRDCRRIAKIVLFVAMESGLAGYVATWNDGVRRMRVYQYLPSLVEK
jgi:hypothetical protein